MLILDEDSLRYEGTLIGGEPVNRVAIDQFTFLHFLSGFAAAFLLKAFGMNGWMGAGLVLILAILWELAEPMAKDWNPDLFPNPSKDSAINKTFDVLGTITGYLIGVWISNVG